MPRRNQKGIVGDLLGVHIYADTDNILEDFDGIIVTKPREYVDAYKEIQQAIYAGNELKLLIKNRYCLECFRRMQASYGIERIEITVYSPRDEFLKSCGIHVPDYISDQDIVESGILKQQESMHYQAGIEFEAFVMGIYVTDELALEKFPWKRLLYILEQMDFGKLEKNRAISLVNKVMLHRLSQWKANAQAKWAENILDQFMASPQNLFHSLGQYVLASRYPIAVPRAVVGDLALDFAKAGFVDAQFYSDALDYSRLRKEIELFLHSLPDKDLEYEEIADLINAVSGYFPEEFVFIMKVFTNHRRLIDHTLLNRALQKFRTVEVLIPDYDEKLNQIVPPAKPSAPLVSFGIDEWLNWAVKEYLPYRFWMEENGKLDESIDDYAVSYGDWIYNNYSFLLSSGQNMLLNTMPILNKELTNSELSLIVIIDNFNYKYVELLKEYFMSREFNSIDETPLLAMLPTVTEVSKRSIFTGESYSSKTSINYPNEVQKWARMLGKSIKYLKNIGELNSLHSKQEDIIFLNYLQIDDILHKGQKESALSTRAKVKNELSALCQQITAFAKRVGYENKIKIFVVSDHGSTKVVAKQESMTVPAYFYRGKSDDDDHRFITINDQNMASLHGDIGQYCYVLDKGRFGTKENYLIARRYYRFKDSDDTYYVHGGITPEEQIVPLLKFERVETKAEELLISLMSNEFRLAAKSKISLIVKNPNEYAITDLSIKIVNENVKGDSKLAEVSRVEKLSIVEATFDNVRFTQSGTDADFLTLAVTYKLLGKEYGQEFNLPFVIKRMQKNTIKLDDIF